MGLGIKKKINRWVKKNVETANIRSMNWLCSLLSRKLLIFYTTHAEFACSCDGTTIDSLVVHVFVINKAWFSMPPMQNLHVYVPVVQRVMWEYTIWYRRLQKEGTSQCTVKPIVNHDLKLFLILTSDEHEIYPVNEYQNTKNFFPVVQSWT